MGTSNDHTLNINLFIEQIERNIDLMEKNAQHMNDNEVSKSLIFVLKRYMKLIKKEIQPSSSSIRFLKDFEDSEIDNE